MSVTTEAVPKTRLPMTEPALPWSLPVGVALASFSALALELALTRLFSVVLFYHFAFLAISIALLGLGSGGVFAYLLKNRLNRFPARPLLAALSTANALLIPIVLEIVLHVPVSLELSWTNFFRLTVIYFASALPFFLTGLQFSILFARESEHIPRLYGSDLLGGAMACLAVVPLLNWIGGPNTVLSAALAAAGAAVVWSAGDRARNLPTVVAAALLVLIAANHSGRWIDIVYAKGILRNQSWVEFARWNAISRVEVDRQADARAVVIDADASTYIMNADPRQWQDPEWRHDLMSAAPGLVNVLRPRGDYAIIGPGGGVDVLRALANGSPRVVGIEINSIIANTVMRDRYAGYSYHLYQRPEVRIHVTDGRSFIRNAKQSFDVLQMTLVDTWASTAAGAFALSENSLYTVEAFREYFRHLKPDGVIAITRWEFHQPREALRVVSVAMQALHDLGVRNPAANFIVVSQGPLDADGIPVVVLAKKSSFSAAEEAAVSAHLRDYPEMSALYLPSAPQNNPFAALIAANDPYAFARRYPYNVAPVTDNAPFFFFTLKLSQVLGEDELQQGIDWKVNLGVVVLAAVLAVSLLAVIAFLVLPLALRGANWSNLSRLPYFVAIGLGYILVEVAFIQRFVLFLGHPTYALTVVVFLLLLSSGAGSLVVRRWPHGQAAWLPLCLIVIATLACVLFLPRSLNALVGLPFPLKLLLSAIVLAPLGFAMGMPFPAGLKSLASALASMPAQPANDNAVEWAWAVNAGSTVLGSVLAMVIAIQFGLNITLACAAAAYLFALLLLPRLRPDRA